MAQPKLGTARTRDEGERGIMRLLACFAAVVATFGRNKGNTRSSNPVRRLFSASALGPRACGQFLRGPSRIRPPEAIAGPLRFIGRHTLEIYASSLPAPTLVKLVPDLAP